MRLAACVEYDGSGFRGWQTQQEGVRTVQEEVEKGLSVVASENISVVCSGRTDAGVHSKGQIIHFDTNAVRNERSWLLGTNTNMAHDVALVSIKSVSDDFHARFSAVARCYRYIIHQRMVKSALMRERAWWVYRPLDIDKMQQAAAYLIGEHDFSSFRAAQCQSNTPMRNVHYINLSREDEMIYVDIKANAFLHHMVRNIVGLLVEIGKGAKPAQWCKDVLEARDRKEAAITAPPQGLYFMSAEYPPGVY